MAYKDTQAAFDRFVRVAGPLLEEGERYVLQIGSPTNGRAWRLYKSPEGSYAQHPTVFGDYLGWTSKEAEVKLHAYCDGIEAERCHAKAPKMASVFGIGKLSEVIVNIPPGEIVR